MTTKEKIDQFVGSIIAVMNGYKFNNKQDIVLGLTPVIFPPWEVGAKFAAGEVCNYNDKKYYTSTGVSYCVAGQEPGAIGTEAIWECFTDETSKNWIYNEYVKAGWIRYDNGAAYRTRYTLTGNNLTAPSQSLAVWELIETI